MDFGLLGKSCTVSSLMSTIQTAGLETGLDSMESRILSLVISTRLCLNQQLAVVVVKPKFYFKQIPHMLCVTAVSSWRKALYSSGWGYKQVMRFKVLVIPILDAHGLPLTQQRENFMEKQFWRSRERCETTELIYWGNISQHSLHHRMLSWSYLTINITIRPALPRQWWLMWILCSKSHWCSLWLAENLHHCVLRQEFVWFWWWQLSFALPV